MHQDGQDHLDGPILLSRLTMLRLTSRTMAQLAIQRLLATEFVPDLPAVAARLVARLEVLVGLVDAVRGAELPVVLLGQGLLGFGFAFVHLVGGGGEGPGGDGFPRGRGEGGARCWPCDGPAGVECGGYEVFACRVYDSVKITRHELSGRRFGVKGGGRRLKVPDLTLCKRKVVGETFT
jgi:hypothetical protein